MSRDPLKLTLVDAFTRSPFRGVPVAVLVPREAPPFEHAQAVARELSGVDVVFLTAEGANRYGMRHFEGGAPALWSSEAAALASAHVLWSEGHAGHLEPLMLATGAGIIEARKRADHLALSLEPSVPTPTEQILELASVDLVAGFVPTAAHFPRRETTTLLVTARSSRPPVDFVTRVFVATDGIIGELPPARLAYARLGWYWLERLQVPLLLGEHLGDRSVAIHVEGTTVAGRIIVCGQAVTVMKGVFTARP
jgi:predicted PhzF superfamily epimerase YddE/YHI9